MRWFRDPFFLATIATSVAVAGTVSAIAIVFMSPLAYQTSQAQQQRYVVSRPERCNEIITGGLDSGEYLFCKTPEGHSIFYKSFDATDWTERQYK